MANTLIDFIRHGQPEGGSRYRGNTVDDPLSELGWAQMWATLGEECPWDHIVSSPMQRCLSFARALSDKHHLPLSMDDRFREVGFGEWEGLAREKVKTGLHEAYQAFYADPVNNRPNGAEPLDKFAARVGEAVDVTKEKFAGCHVIVVCHAGVIRGVVRHVLNMPLDTLYRVVVNNAGLTRIQSNDQGWELAFHNRLALQ